MTSVTTRIERGRVGEAVLRSDATPKVTGEFEYSSDLEAAGMLWGKTVRSPHVHARIVGLDVSEALGMQGVHAVLTHADVPGSKTYGLEFADQPVLAAERVRYHGEPVALVAAEEPEQARRAAAAVHVEYVPLEPVVDMERALEQEPLHPERPTMGHGYLDDPRPNVVRHIVVRRGDPEVAGDVSVEGYYELGIQDQAFLGPESGLAVPDGEGGVDIYVATQWLHVDRGQVAPCLGLPEELVRIHLSGVGGAFGGREDLSMQVHGAMLALRTGRPVKMVYSREESFVGHIHRHPARIWAEHRASRAGEIVCARMRILLDGGAYASTTAAVAANAASFAYGPYRVANALIEATGVYTNNPPCGAMRGFGAVQTCFAAEAQMDKLAAELAIDPVELRLLNALGPGDTLATGQEITGSFPVAEVIRRAAAISVPEPEALPREPIRLPGGAGNTTRGEGIRRGVGFAVGFKNICYSEGYDDFTAARVRLLARRERRGSLRRGGGRAGGERRHPPGRAHRARHRARRPRACGDGHRRLRRLVLGLPDDLDGRRRRPPRLPGGGRGARACRQRRGRRGAHLPPPADDPARSGDRAGDRRAGARGLRRRGHARRGRGGRRPRASRGWCGSAPRRTSAERSTLPPSKVRSREARPRAWGWP